MAAALLPVRKWDEISLVYLLIINNLGWIWIWTGRRLFCTLPALTSGQSSTAAFFVNILSNRYTHMMRDFYLKAIIHT